MGLRPSLDLRARAPQTAIAMHFHACRSRDELEALLTSREFLHRYLLVERLVEYFRREQRLGYPAICWACEAASELELDAQDAAVRSDGSLVPNFRERLRCPTCGLNSRQRMAVEFARRWGAEIAPREGARVFLLEQVTPIFRAFALLFPQHEVIGSEYLGPGLRSGASVRGLRHEDVERLSFPSEVFDLVVSNDVMEHLPHPWQGFAEFQRVLRPGGQLYLTVPFDACSPEQSVTRATRDGERLVHVLEPRYHGNPMSAEGSLVFTDFGWDLFPRLRELGFSDVRLVVLWSYEHGFLEIPGSYFLAVK
jgi:SAM-dependent methyltransferase